MKTRTFFFVSCHYMVPCIPFMLHLACVSLLNMFSKNPFGLLDRIPVAYNNCFPLCSCRTVPCSSWYRFVYSLSFSSQFPFLCDVYSIVLLHFDCLSFCSIQIILMHTGFFLSDFCNIFSGPLHFALCNESAMFIVYY